MASDYTVKQGDSLPVLTDTLTYSDKSAVDLTGASIGIVIRSLTAASPLALNGQVTSASPAVGAVQYAPTSADTQLPGLYQANWQVTFPNGKLMSFPTTGYLSVTIEENLVTIGGQQLVSISDAKDYLNIAPGDRSHDAKLGRFIKAIEPVVEHITGPIILRTYSEWHDGGQDFIVLRRRPSSGYGTTPVLTLLTATEYIGSTAYPLTIITSPNQGTTYSVMLESDGRVVRRTSGGGVRAFGAGAFFASGGAPGYASSKQAVNVTYQAGQSTVPPNVYEGCLELLRLNYQKSQQAGRGRATALAEDEEPTGPMMGFAVPGRVREMLAPTRRAPAVA